jgi:ankyrin repeat protein
MDPLSIAASVAGLLTLTVQVIGICDSLYNDVKKRPKLLKDLSTDLNCLASVLEQLQNSLTEKATGDEEPLRRCLDGCHTAIQDVQKELDAVKALFVKNIVAKTYAQLTFKSKMAAIMESQERVDRFTGAVNVALAVRQHVSAKVVHTKLDQLAVEIIQVKKSSSGTAKWVDPLQQYVDTGFAVLTKSATSSASSVTSSSTLVDGAASTASIQQLGTTTDTDAIASFGSFDDWLDSFAQEEDGKRVQPEEPDQIKTSPVLDLASVKRNSSAPYKAQILVNGLPVGLDDPLRGQAPTLNLSLSDIWDDALKLLQQKGYRKICGFRLGSTLLTPVASYAEEVYVSVTKGPSKYSMAGGLRINIDTPLELYFDDFVRVGETGQGVQPMSISKMSDEGKIAVVDQFGDSSKKIEVGFSRTLRVPEDGILYNPPVLLSPFSLINTEELTVDRLSLRKKGGLLVPLWQREALALTFSGEPPKYRHMKVPAEFAIRIYAASVNVVSGATSKQSAEDDAQDYVLAPLQNRLDGFLVRAGVVKQFVSMPLGSGYTAEGQITGREVLGGLQVLIAPRFRARGTFKGHEDQRKTPRQFGLRVDDRLFMAGNAVTSRAKEFGYGDISKYFTEDGCMFHSSEEGRPLFVHEMAVQFSGMGNLSKPLSLTAVLPYKLDIVVRPPKEYVSTRYSPGRYVGLRRTRCSQVELPREYSPFLGVNDMAKRLAKLLVVDQVVLFNSSNDEIQRPSEYVPIHMFLADNAVIYCQGYKHEYFVGAGAEHEPPVVVKPKKELRWDMGLAPGGEIKQAVVPDSEPLEWNWVRARLVNVQIINSVVFEAVTGIAPPPPPISFKDYLKAKLPFFDLIGDASIQGGKVLGKLQSVGQRDAKACIPLQASLSKSTKVVGCVVCEENLADSILKPCNHVFCGLCIRDLMYQDDRTRCAACRKVAKEVVSFGAPMEIPLVVEQSSAGRDGIEKHQQQSKSAIDSTLKEDADTSDTAISKVDAVPDGVLIQPASRLQRLALSGMKDASLEIDALLAEGSGHCEKVSCDNGRTAMQIAASIGNLDLLEKLIAAKISVNELPCATNGRTSLQAAAERGDLPIVTRLLAAGADPNGPVSLFGGLTALEGAAKIGHVGILALLLQHGASVRSHRTRRSALHHAAEKGHETAVAVLLAYGFDPETQVDLTDEEPKSLGYSWAKLFSPSEIAAKRGHLGVLKVLRNNGATANPIYTACQYGHVQIVCWLLDVLENEEAQRKSFQAPQNEDDEDEENDYYRYNTYGRSIDYTVDHFGYPKRDGLEGKLDSLLEIAAEHGQLEVLKLLLNRGALLRVPGRGTEVKPDNETTENRPPTYFGSTLLHKAAESSSAATVAYLLTQGFELEEFRVYEQKTPLMAAAQAGQFTTFDFLLAQGANIHAVDDSGWTVAIAAARGGSEDILRLLFSHDVDLTKMGRSSESVLTAALNSGHESAARLILEQLDKQKHESCYNACLSGALGVASKMALVSFVRELLGRGTDPNFNHPLQYMGIYIRGETNIDDAIECARLLFAKGGTVTDFSKILKQLEYDEKNKLATVFVQNYVGGGIQGKEDVNWAEHIENAAKKCDVEYVRALIGAYRWALDKKDGQAFIPWDWRLHSGFDVAVESGQLEIVDLLLGASTKEDAKRYVDGVSRRLGSKDHARRYLEERYVLKAPEAEPRYQHQQRWSDTFRRPAQFLGFGI